MPRKNSRFGQCDCGVAVQPQAGYIYKPQGARYWQVSCTSTACLNAHGITLQDPTPRLSAAGLLTFPYDPERVAIVKALPYPARRWDGDSKAWNVKPGLESDRFRPTVQVIGVPNVVRMYGTPSSLFLEVFPFMRSPTLAPSFSFLSRPNTSLLTAFAPRALFPMPVFAFTSDQLAVTLPLNLTAGWGGGARADPMNVDEQRSMYSKMSSSRPKK